MRHLMPKGKVLDGTDLELLMDLELKYKVMGQNVVDGDVYITKNTSGLPSLSLLGGIIFDTKESLEKQVGEILTMYYHAYGITDDPLTLCAFELQAQILKLVKNVKKKEIV